MTIENHFKIIIPSYNNEKWLRACLNSVKLQKYENYQCIIVDDCSTDKSTTIIEEEIADNDKFVLVKNKTRKLALRNIYEAIELSEPNQGGCNHYFRWGRLDGYKKYTRNFKQYISNVELLDDIRQLYGIPFQKPRQVRSTDSSGRN